MADVKRLLQGAIQCISNVYPTHITVTVKAKLNSFGPSDSWGRRQNCPARPRAKCYWQMKERRWMAASTSLEKIWKKYANSNMKGEGNLSFAERRSPLNGLLELIISEAVLLESCQSLVRGADGFTFSVDSFDTSFLSMAKPSTRQRASALFSGCDEFAAYPFWLIDLYPFDWSVLFRSPWRQDVSHPWSSRSIPVFMPSNPKTQLTCRCRPDMQRACLKGQTNLKMCFFISPSIHQNLQDKKKVWDHGISDLVKIWKWRTSLVRVCIGKLELRMDLKPGPATATRARLPWLIAMTCLGLEGLAPDADSMHGFVEAITGYSADLYTIHKSSANFWAISKSLVLCTSCCLLLSICLRHDMHARNNASTFWNENVTAT